MKKNIIVLLFFVSICFSQESKRPLRLENLTQRYVDFDNAQQYDSISKILFEYESLPNLSLLEKQILYFFKGNLNTRILKFEDGFLNYKKSLAFYDKSKAATRPYAICLACISDLYFTKKKYKEANAYALKAKMFVPKEYYFEYINIRIINAYYNYLTKDYTKSLTNYTEVEKFIVENKDECKLSEVQIKKAELLSAMGDFEMALSLVNKSIQRSSKCKHDVVVRNARITKEKILREHDLLKEALIEKDSITIAEEKLGLDIRNQKIDQLETQYKTKLKEQQNKTLTLINSEKEKTLDKQKRILIIGAIGIFILSLLLYFVFKLSKKQKQTNKILALQNEKIEENNKTLNRLNLLNQKIFSVISHDFKGPITTLQFTLSKSNSIFSDNSEIKNYINDISNQLTQSDAMLNNLLDWAKTELITTNTEFNIFNLHNCVLLAIADNQIKISEKSIQIVNNILPENNIQFNEAVLKIVLRNIINNAVKFSYENSKIEISYTNNEIFITDYGKGIDAKKLSKLFTQNVNAGLGTNLETGFGMGLYLCYELMQKNNGSIIAENNTKNGVTFIIKLKN